MRGLVVVAAGLAVLLLAGCGESDSRALPEGRSLTASSAVAPEVALFGDVVEARVDVLLDENEIDADRVTFEPDFTPYEVVGEPVVERKRVGDFLQLRYRYAIRCITLDCIALIGGGPSQPGAGGIPPPATGSGGFGERKTIQLKASNLRYDNPDGEERTLRRIAWPPLQSVSRLNFGDTAVAGVGFPFEASVSPLPEATFRVPPLALGVGLFLAAAALLALPVVVFGRMLRREPEVVVLAEVRELTPLERALALVEWSLEQGDRERREALEVLAEELDSEDRAGLAKDARHLAWAPAPPAPEATSALVEAVKEDDGSPA